MEIKEFQRKMYEIYGERDKKRGIEKTYMWAIEEMGELVRAIRKSNREEIGSEFADVIAWLFSLANLLELDIENVLKKYANTCPKCKKNPCTCEEGWKN